MEPDTPDTPGNPEPSETPETVAIVALAMDYSGRLGHRYIGSEHLLLALVSSSQPTGAVLRENGVTPERVEEIIRRGVQGADGGPSGSLDQSALAAIGVDIDAIRARIESSSAADATASGGSALARVTRKTRRDLRRLRRDGTAFLMARRHRRNVAELKPVPLRALPHLWRHEYTAAQPLAAAPGALQSLQESRDETRAQQSNTQSVALALTVLDEGRVPPILEALGVEGTVLRAAILHRYREAD